jgi:hypothetical protein
MSSTNPPNPNVDAFNNLYWTAIDEALTTIDGDKRYLRFPTAQGKETFQNIDVNGISQFNTNITFGSSTSADLTPIFTTNKTNIIIGVGGEGQMDIECPLSLSNANITQTDQQVGSFNTLQSTTFSNTAVGSLTSSATQPASNDSSTNVPTTAWVQTAISTTPSILCSNNTFTGTNDFTNDITIGSPSSTNFTPIFTTNNTKLELGSGGSGKINVNCPLEVQGFGILNLTSAPLNLNANANITQAGQGVSNLNTLQSTTFINTAVGSLTSSATQPASNDSSTNVPTTAWVQTAVDAKIPTSILGSNNTFTGTNDFTNTAIGSLTSSATQPVSNDSSTKVPTTAWVQTAISSVEAPIDLSLNSLIINSSTLTQSTFGITNNWNSNSAISFSGTGSIASQFTTMGAILANRYLLITSGEVSAGQTQLPPANAITSLFEINFTFFNNSFWGQTTCFLQLYPNRFFNNLSDVPKWNINNNINGNGNYEQTSTLYAPNGRWYWTYQQNFSLLSGAQAYLVPKNNSVVVFFVIPDGYSFECSAKCLDASLMTTNGSSWNLQVGNTTTYVFNP